MGRLVGSAIAFCLSLTLTCVTSIANDHSGELFSVEADPVQFLEETAQDIRQKVDSPSTAASPDWTDSDWNMMNLVPEDEDYEPPLGASHHPGGEEAIAVHSDLVSTKRYMEKARPQKDGDATTAPRHQRSADEWRKVSFSSGSFMENKHPSIG